MRLLLLFVYATLLTGCLNDGASFKINGPNHSLSLTRTQSYFWDSKIELHMVVQRIPDCQRRHTLNPISANSLNAELFSIDENTYFLKQSHYIYSFETTTCNGFETMKETPDSGIGKKLGVFKEINGAFRFVPEATNSS